MPVQPSEQQVKDLKKTQADLWEKATMQESIVRQKSRCRWIKDADALYIFLNFKVLKFLKVQNCIQILDHLMNDEMFAFVFVSSSVDYEDKLKKKRKHISSSLQDMLL